jgi:C-terminal processing protease CtpA/Prc
LEKYDAKGNVVESVPINKLTDVNQVYVLTSNRTASASELVINGLIPYMNVILIGDVTYGKNVGSVTLYEEDPQKQKTNTWGIQPIIVKLANVNNESGYGNGFLPDVQVSEYDALPSFLPLGDTNERMLQTALIRMGVLSESLRSAGKIENPPFHPVSSSIERTPARRNLYMNPDKLLK